jgi:hypothetical protein
MGVLQDFRGEKKPPGLLAVFREFWGASRALVPLSIRQRSEIPKKVKVKLGGHGESKVAGQKG